MNKILVVIACYVFVVGPAQAGDRRSAESCKHLQEMKVTAKGVSRAEARFWALLPILTAQQNRCGVDVSAEFAAAKAAGGAEIDVETRGRSRAGRAPVLCDTTPKAYGGSTTDCFWRFLFQPRLACSARTLRFERALLPPSRPSCAASPSGDG
jgi:hypothetical protein